MDKETIMKFYILIVFSNLVTFGFIIVARIGIYYALLFNNLLRDDEKIIIMDAAFNLIKSVILTVPLYFYV